jgi:uncharacterized LabA/DUF88 family protein
MTAPLSNPPDPTIAYIDGFNLYYGALSQTPYRWLDLDQLVRRLRPHDQIVKVKYFTALIDGPSQQKQKTYLEALSSLPSIEIVMGNFKRKTVECGNTSCPGNLRANRRFQTYEEKRTDVNIALHMLDDAHQGRSIRFILISGDSDLVPAIELVSAKMTTAKIDVYIPVPQNKAGARERAYKKELRAVSTSVRALPSQLFQRSLLPNPVIVGPGKSAARPIGWDAPKTRRQFTFAPQAIGQCGWCGKT